MAVTGTYTQIKQLRDNGSLVAGEEYIISDYPNFQVHVFAESTDKMGVSGYTILSGDTHSPLMYDLDNDDKYDWSSTKGWVYYLSDPDSNVSAYFDWTDTFTGTLNDINFPEVRDENDKLKKPSIILKDSSDVSIAGYMYGSWNISDSQHIIIGYMNEDISIEESSFVTIGDNNETITISGCEGVLIGDGNFMITVENSDGVEVGSDNEEMTIGADNNITGSKNKYMEITKSTNVIGSLCRDVLVDSKWNTVKNTINSSIRGNFSLIEDSDSVELDAESVGNNLTRARIVSLEKVNNNNINTSNMSLVETGSFNEYVDVGKIRTYKDVAKESVMNQADNFGTVLNIERNKMLVSEAGAMDYTMNEGVWMAKTTPGKSQTDMHFTIRLNIPPELDRIATFHGGGTYSYGDEVEIYATGTGFTIHGYIDNANGIVHQGSTWTFDAGINMVIIPQYTID